MLAQFAALTSVITSILFLKNRVLFRESPNSILLIYIVICGITDLVTGIMGYFHQSNIQIINLFYFVQFVMLANFLLHYLKRTSLKMVLIAFSILLVVYSIFDISRHFHEQKITGQSISIQALTLTLLSIILLLKRTFHADELLTTDPVFWFISAILLYSSLSALVFVTSEMCFGNLENIRQFTWSINSFATIFSNILYLLGLRCLKTQTKSSLPFM